MTPDERAVVGRIGDRVAHRQDRLPEGTLWRSKELGGTFRPDDLCMGGVFLVHHGLYTREQKYIDATNMVVARHAFAGIAKNLTAAGAVHGTGLGTHIGRTLDFHLNRQRPPNDPHGCGAVMLAGTEIFPAE